jgi:hypothetical protein
MAKYGGGKTKGQEYALDPSRLADIQSLANDGLVADEAVQRWLFKDSALVSARSVGGWEPI